MSKEIIFASAILGGAFLLTQRRDLIPQPIKDIVPEMTIPNIDIRMPDIEIRDLVTEVRDNVQVPIPDINIPDIIIPDIRKMIDESFKDIEQFTDNIIPDISIPDIPEKIDIDIGFGVNVPDMGLGGISRGIGYKAHALGSAIMGGVDTVHNHLFETVPQFWGVFVPEIITDAVRYAPRNIRKGLQFNVGDWFRW